MRNLRSLSLLSLLGAAAASHAAVLDFEGLSGTAGPFYTDHGYTVDQGGYELATPAGFGSWTSTSPAQTNYALYTGSTALYAHGNADPVTLKRMDGASFDLMSLDVASAWNSTFTANYGLPPQTILFTGTHPDGTKVTRSYTTELNDHLNTVLFSGFTNLTSLVWTNEAPYHQFDNVNVRAAVQATPEPASLAALAVGAVTLLRRRKRM